MLDFGLAKAIDDPVTSGDPSQSPTLTLGATRLGMILGTAAYMSPEQANGYPADRRADIWSFGAVLYEMLAGKKAFAGESVSDTLATVLKLDPDWNALPADTPAPIRKLIRRCLTKDRKQRLQASGEARIVIEETLSGSASEEADSAEGLSHRLPWAVAAALVVALGVALWAPWRSTRPAEKPLLRLDVDLGPEVSLPPVVAGQRSFVPSIVISPDGTRLQHTRRASQAGRRGSSRGAWIDPKPPNSRAQPRRSDRTFPRTGSGWDFLQTANSTRSRWKAARWSRWPRRTERPERAGTRTAASSWAGCSTRASTRIPSGGGARTKVTDLANGELARQIRKFFPEGRRCCL